MTSQIFRRGGGSSALRSREFIRFVMVRKIGFFETFGTNITLFPVRQYWTEENESEIVCRNSWRFSYLRIQIIFNKKSAVGSDQEREGSLCQPKFCLCSEFFP